MTQPTIKKGALDVGTIADKVVALDGTGKLPAVDGSQLTNVVGLPAGADTQIQYNNAGAFDASPEFTLVGNTLHVGTTTAGNITLGGSAAISTIQAGGTGELKIAGATGSNAQVTIAGATNAGGSGGAVLVGGGFGGVGNGGNLLLQGGDGQATGGSIRLTMGKGITTDGVVELRPPASAGAGTAPKLNFYNDNASPLRYVSLSAGTAIPVSRDWILPRDDPATAAGKFLTTDAGGNLSFATVPTTAQSFTSAQFASTASTLRTAAHGLGAKPDIVQLVAICLVAEFGYSIGEEVVMNSAVSDFDEGTGPGRESNLLSYDATNVYFAVASGGLHTSDKSAPGGFVTLTPASWNILVKAILI